MQDFLIRHDLSGAIITERDHDSNIPGFSNSSAFPLASVSKIFASVLVAKVLAERNLTLSHIIPESQLWKNIPALQDATWGDLLSHSTCLPTYADFTSQNQARTQPLSQQDFYKLLESGRENTTTTDLRYNNGNYIVLGDALSALGEAYQDAFERLIAKPLSLEHTRFITSTHDQLLPRGFHDTGSPAHAEHGSWLGLGAGVATSVNDLRKFINGLSDPKFIDPSTLAKLYTAHNFGYGFGWTTYELSSKRKIIGHEGGISGYSTQLLIDPNSLQSGRKPNFVMLFLNKECMYVDKLALQFFQEQENHQIR